MDGRCKAAFDASIPSYVCAHCSPDCLVNQAVCAAKEKGYDVYVIPGGSCVGKILKSANYEGIVGVACGEEIKLSSELLSDTGVAGQSIPLIKNGCSSTVFNMDTLAKTLELEIFTLRFLVSSSAGSCPCICGISPRLQRCVHRSPCRFSCTTCAVALWLFSLGLISALYR